MFKIPLVQYFIYPLVYICLKLCQINLLILHHAFAPSLWFPSWYAEPRSKIRLEYKPCCGTATPGYSTMSPSGKGSLCLLSRRRVAHLLLSGLSRKTWELDTSELICQNFSTLIQCFCSYEMFLKIQTFYLIVCVACLTLTMTRSELVAFLLLYNYT